MQIYNEKISDLIDIKKENLEVRESTKLGIYVEGLTLKYVDSSEELFRWIEFGNGNRKVGSHDMNKVSSRSHSIVQINLGQENMETGSKIEGKLFLVDLAGSERVGKTGATGSRLEEAKHINKSLSALGSVINSLTDEKKTHIPYRDSKLTRILQESLGGNAKTTLVIACSPASDNEEETLCSLRFGQRAKLIKNKAMINKQLTVEECKKIIDELQKQLDYKNARIYQLEQFIKENGLKVPGDEDVIKQLEKTNNNLENNVEDIPLTEEEKINNEKEYIQLAKKYESIGDTIKLDDDLLEALNNDENKGLRDQILSVNNKIKDKDETIKKLNEQLDESDKFVKKLEETYKTQIKTYEEMSEKGKNVDTLKDKIELLESQLKIKEETLWEIKQLYKDDPKLVNILQKTDEKVDK